MCIPTHTTLLGNLIGANSVVWISRCPRPSERENDLLYPVYHPSSGTGQSAFQALDHCWKCRWVGSEHTSRQQTIIGLQLAAEKAPASEITAKIFSMTCPLLLAHWSSVTRLLWLRSNIPRFMTSARLTKLPSPKMILCITCNQRATSIIAQTTYQFRIIF